MSMSVVYDISELDALNDFSYDVKILYQLKGYRFKTFHELCNLFLDESTIQPYQEQSDRIKAHIRSYSKCNISVENYPMTDLLPKNVMDNFYETRQILVDRLFRRFSDEQVFSFYETFFPKIKCLYDIAQNLHLKFNFVGSKTGRLSFKKNTFNPYGLSKQSRSCIKARPGYHICEYDLKSSQPRIAIFSTFDSSFKDKFRTVDDIYALFPGDRERNKISFLRWMFGSGHIEDLQFDAVAHPIKELRKAISCDASKCGIIHNRFNRPLFFGGEADNIVFQNFIASTEADALYETICKMQTALKGKQSRILFPFYDAVICEIKDDEKETEQQLKTMIEDNYMDHIFYCRFPVEMRTGQTFGDLH